jgi:hypothetical protein
MSMPPEVMNALSAGGGGAGAGPPPPAPPPEMPGAASDSGAPGGAPMMTPQAPAGNVQKGKLQAIAGMKMLEQALVTLGSHTDEGAAVNKALSTLTKLFGKDAASSSDLMPSERKSIAAALPGGAGPPGGGAPPGGMPPPPGGGGAPMGAPPGM